MKSLERDPEKQFSTGRCYEENYEAILELRAT